MVDPTATLGSSRHLQARDTFYRSTGWGDQQGVVREADGKNSLVWEEYQDTEFVEAFMSSAAPGQSTKLSFKFQFDHDWDVDAEDSIRFHMHWEPQADPPADQVVKLSGYYYWSRIGAATPALAGWTTFSKSLTVSNGDIYIPRVDLITAIPIASYAVESSILKVFLQRDITDPEDTYSTAKGYGTANANVMVDYIDSHYWRGKVGTKDEYPTS